MIQVIPQISASPEAGKAQAPEQGSLKKDKLGVFARLLEGLIGKRKTPGSAKDAPPAEEKGAEALEAAGKLRTRDRKKIFAALPGAAEEAARAETPHTWFLSPNPRAVDQKLPGEEKAPEAGGGKTLLQQEPLTGLNVREPSPGEDLPDIPPPESLAELRGAGAAPVELPQGTMVFQEEAPPREPESGDRRLTEKEPAPRALVDIFPYVSGRDPGAESFRFEGIKRTGMTGTEKEDRGNSGAPGTRNSKRSRERLSFQVQDLRSGENAEPALRTENGETIRPLRSGESPDLDLTVNLRSGGREPEDRSNAGLISAPGRAFEDLLARELHQNLNGDIVRHASIILKDGGEGTIRLSLRPETLGTVKIRLEMAENKITGHIVVESGEALRAFEREIHSLEEAFRESGFESASLDMSLASGNGRDGSGQWQGEDRGNPYSESLAASLYDMAGERAGLSEPGSPLSADGSGREAVNMLI